MCHSLHQRVSSLRRRRFSCRCRKLPCVVGNSSSVVGNSSFVVGSSSFVAVEGCCCVGRWALCVTESPCVVGQLERVRASASCGAARRRRVRLEGFSVRGRGAPRSRSRPCLAGFGGLLSRLSATLSFLELHANDVDAQAVHAEAGANRSDGLPNRRRRPADRPKLLPMHPHGRALRVNRGADRSKGLAYSPGWGALQLDADVFELEREALRLDFLPFQPDAVTYRHDLEAFAVRIGANCPQGCRIRPLPMTSRSSVVGGEFRRETNG